jgi:1-acyl-sn-glycerol-3-phosphate acyltransferase
MGKRFRRGARQTKHALAVATSALYGLWEHRKLGPKASRADCAQWLHESCARGVRGLHVQVLATGEFPSRGMIVSNHLSYLDIPILSAAGPCVFVSKADVEQWPVFGRYARWAGSVFVRRQDRADAPRANNSVSDALSNGVPVVLFPEGTTTDGRSVLRFHSTMLQPAIDSGAMVTPCAIAYELEEGDVAQEVCWWGDMTFLPHAWNLLGKKVIRARILFGEAVQASGDRKEFSQELHERVVRLHQQLASSDTNIQLATRVSDCRDIAGRYWR